MRAALPRAAGRPRVRRSQQPHLEHLQVPRRPLGAEAPLLLELEAVVAQLRPRRLGHQHLPRLGRRRDPGGDVHVHPQVVATDLPRSPDVNAGADARLVALGLDLGETAVRFAHRAHGRARVREHRHVPVAEALHHLALVLLDRWLDGPGHLAQQLHGLGVPDLERPGRELDQVREEDRAALRSPTPALRLRHRLVHLERREPDLPQRARPLGDLGQVARELVKRAASSNEGTEYADVLHELEHEIAEDRAALVRLMERFDVARDRLKVTSAFIGEKLGRLKPNAHLLSYSPLSRAEELEILCLGIDGKHALWRALLDLEQADERLDPEELQALADRAAAQRAELEPYRLRAVEEALVAPARA